MTRNHSSLSRRKSSSKACNMEQHKTSTNTYRNLLYGTARLYYYDFESKGFHEVLSISLLVLRGRDLSKIWAQLRRPVANLSEDWKLFGTGRRGIYSIAASVWRRRLLPCSGKFRKPLHCGLQPIRKQLLSWPSCAQKAYFTWNMLLKLKRPLLRCKMLECRVKNSEFFTAALRILGAQGLPSMELLVVGLII